MSALPGAGWYDDGVTAGVVRWFDGAAWTEHTRAVDPPAPAAYTSTIGRVPAGRLGESLNLADRVTESADFRNLRHGEALALRRRGLGTVALAVVVLLVTGAIGIAMGGADTIWYVGAVAGVVLCVRAWRDYRNATYRGAPTLSAAGWGLVGTLLALGFAALAAGPVIAVRAIAEIVGAAGR